jgi:3-methyladenine DNA glycosylase AlkD
VPVDPVRASAEIEQQLRAIGTPERAAGEKRYLKSQLDHLGATVWQNRRTIRGFVKQHSDLTHAELVAVSGALWSSGIFDCRLAAGLLLDARKELLTADDLSFLKELVRDSHTWALVDLLAGDVIGGFLVRQPEAADSLDQWARDADFWIRRAALLSNLRPLANGGGFDRFAGYADSMLDEREFFIRKAIGWVLREEGKRDPDRVYEWLAPRIDRASGVTVREAVKYLDPPRREELMTRYKAGARRGRSSPRS